MADACAHCQQALLPGAPGVHRSPDGRAWCCRGCATARAVIERLGLQRFDALGGTPGPVADIEVDERASLALQEQATAALAGNCRVRVDVEGVTCASCAWLVEKVAQRVGGVRGATLNPARGELELLLAEGFEARPLAVALAAVGHRVMPSNERTGERVASGVDELLFRLGISAAAAMAAMISSFALFFGLEPGSPWGRLFTGLAAVASVVAVLIGGQPFVRGAWRSLRRGAPTMDVPIALGMLLAEAGCLLSARAGNVTLFDTVSIFVTLMLLGRILERRLVEKHRSMLLSTDGDVAGLQVRRVMPGGELRFVPVRELQAGHVLQLARGELCPVDARVDGKSRVDDSARSFSFAWLTGESEPRLLRAGDALPAGAHVEDRQGARVIAADAFSASRLAALLSQPTGEPDDRSAASGLFPWLSQAWVAGALGVAAVGAWLWADAGLVRALDVVSALLVVTCPCAFGIAAPLAIERALVLLRARGVFVKSARVWWRAGDVRHAVFDKTGTLTLAEPVLSGASLASLHRWPDDARAALRAVAALSNHGRSRALARALQDLGVERPPLEVEELREDPGHGLSARVRPMRGAEETADAVAVTLERDPEDAAATRVRVGAQTLALRFEEAPRPGVADELERQRVLGVELWLATGDDETKARPLAVRLGIPVEHVRARCTPEDKARLVEELGAARVLAVGDGVNDAAMFARAALCGVPALDRPHLPARADFLLLGSAAGGAFGRVVDLLVLARRVRGVLRGLLAVATLYNLGVVSAGLLGLLTPLMVALLMPASSLSLLLAAWALVRAPASARVDLPAPLLHREVAT